uniref:hypothetical protein n=1 Tax=Xenorhabdus innexi TaxID=290109 RepID=UPI001B802948
RGFDLLFGDDYQIINEAFFLSKNKRLLLKILSMNVTNLRLSKSKYKNKTDSNLLISRGNEYDTRR